MGEQSFIRSSEPVIIVGSNPDGSETTPVGASDNGEVYANDCINTAANDLTLNLTTVAQEVKIGSTRNIKRKYVYMEALSSNIKWGFNTDCKFNLYKNQLIIHPVGDVAVYMKMDSGTGQATIAEGE